MSDDIFIKQDQVLGQQPYIARVPANAQEPNIRQQNQPVNRTAQQPSNYDNRTPVIYQHTVDAQEPNIKPARQPFTYQHRSPGTYDHRSPSTYDHRSPFEYDHRSPSTYDHRSPSIYRHPIIYQHPTTYNHRSPLIYRHPTTSQTTVNYDHRSPFTYDHRSPSSYQHRQPNEYDHRSPFTYNHREPNTYDHRSPSTYQHRQPNTYDHRSPSTYDHRQPLTYDHRSPASINVQSTYSFRQPIIYDAIEGDTTGQNSGFSQAISNWDTTTVEQGPAGYSVESHCSISFAYQTHATTVPWSTYGNASSNSEQGSVHLYYNGGGSYTYATPYFDVVSINGSGSGVTPVVDDTYAVDIKYTVTNQAANAEGYTTAQSSGGSKVSGTYYSLYTGSSSGGSYNGTAAGKVFSWKSAAHPQQSYESRNSFCSANDLEFTIRLSKSGQTSIFTECDVSGFGGGGGGLGNSINLVANAGVGFR